MVFGRFRTAAIVIGCLVVAAVFVPWLPSPDGGQPPSGSAAGPPAPPEPESYRVGSLLFRFPFKPERVELMGRGKERTQLQERHKDVGGVILARSVYIPLSAVWDRPLRSPTRPFIVIRYASNAVAIDFWCRTYNRDGPRIREELVIGRTGPFLVFPGGQNRAFTAFLKSEGREDDSPKSRTYISADGRTVFNVPLVIWPAVEPNFDLSGNDLGFEYRSTIALSYDTTIYYQGLESQIALPDIMFLFSIIEEKSREWHNFPNNDGKTFIHDLGNVC